MSDVANIITNAEIVGTVRIAVDPPSANTGKSPKYNIFNSNYFNCSPNDCTVTLQPGTYLLIANLASIGTDIGSNLQFADINISGTTNGSSTKYKVVTLTSPTTYTHSPKITNANSAGSCICVRLN